MKLMDSPEKVAMIRDVAESWPAHRGFVETGTACGDLPFGVADAFDRIITIEMDDHLYEAAAGRLLPHPNIQVLHGDAGKWFGRALDAMDAPCVVWLDAHEIADDGHASMTAEFDHLAARPSWHVILVDDARLCSGRKGWMTLDGIARWAETNGYVNHGVDHDVVVLTP